MDIKLIALDLDGTLLTTDKRLTKENRNALKRAADSGIEIVPCTGRFYLGIPDNVRELDFIHYAILINGAQVLDIRRDITVYNSEIPLEKALFLMDHIEKLGVAYDAYVQSRGYMEKRFLDNIEEHLPDPIYCRTLRSTRLPVDDIRAFVSELGKDVQKIQMFTGELSVLQETCRYISEEHPDLIATSSLKHNLEINYASANKGDALKALTEYMGIGTENTMAYGDGGNDLPLHRAAGLSVAMGNSLAILKEEADITTLTHDRSGVAFVINKLLDGELPDTAYRNQFYPLHFNMLDI